MTKPPSAADRTWIPGRRFSIFEFGEPIEPHRFGAVTKEEFCQQEGQLAFDGEYRTEDWACSIYTVNGLIHVVDSTGPCLFDGYNIVGSRTDRVFQILGEPPIRWNTVSALDDQAFDGEREGVIDVLGISLFVAEETDIVRSVSLVGTDDQHDARRRAAGAE
jgi:hypothetical protein